MKFKDSVFETSYFDDLSIQNLKFFSISKFQFYFIKISNLFLSVKFNYFLSPLMGRAGQQSQKGCAT